MAAIIRYVDTASAGGDGTTQGHSGATAAYASLAAWEAAEQTDLVAAGNTHTVYCAGTADGTCVVAAWTTGAANDLTIAADPSAPDGDGKNNGSAFDALFYHIANTGTVQGLDLIVNFVTVDGLQILHSPTDTFLGGLTSQLLTAGATHVYKNLRLKSEGTATLTYGVGFNDADCAYSLYNTTIEWVAATAAIGVYQGAATSALMMNVVVEGSVNGVELETGQSMTITNCALFNNTDDIKLSGTATATVTFTAQDDTGDSDGNGQDMSPGTPETDEWPNHVTAYASGDYTPVSGGVLPGNGTATGRLASDINGNAWATNDIGAFRLAAAGGGATGLEFIYYKTLLQGTGY